jgi:predicted enzyme related to lactoylglutathione lyase
MPHLEHVNLTVSDADAFAAALADLFDWKVRWSGEAKGDGRSVHVGDESSYIALYTPQAALEEAPGRYSFNTGLNHIGIFADDLHAAETRIKGAGYTTYSHGDYEPGRRFYFDGPEGVEIEVISYD